MRIIWWKIRRPDNPKQLTWEARGESFTINSSTDAMPIPPSAMGSAEEKPDLLKKLLKWADRTDRL